MNGKISDFRRSRSSHVKMSRLAKSSSITTDMRTTPSTTRAIVTAANASERKETLGHETSLI